MKRRSILFAFLPLLILAAIAASAYVGRDSLKHRLLSIVSDRLQLSNLDMQELRLDAEGIHANAITITRQDHQQDFELVLEDVKLGFSLFPLDLSSLVVARGMLDVTVVAQNRRQTQTSTVSNTRNNGSHNGAPSSVAPPRLPPQLIDLESLRISSLSASLKLPNSNDPVSFAGSADWRSDGNEVSVELANDNEHISIISDSDLQTMILNISQATDTARAIRLEVADALTSQPQFKASSTLATLNDWTESSDLVPVQLRDAIVKFRRSVDDVSISSARFDLTGGLNRNADWPFGPVTLDLDWTSLRRNQCQIDGSILGTLSSTNSKTGTFTINEGRTIIADNCINQGVENSPSQIQARPASGFSVSYDLTTTNDPVVDVGGSIDVNLETEKLSASFAGENIRITDVWNEDGFPGVAHATVAASINLREFSQHFDTTSVDADSLNAEGTFELSQSSRGTPYDLRSSNLQFEIEHLNTNQSGTSVAIDQIEGSGKTTLQLIPSKSDSFQLNSVIDLSTNVIAREITLDDSDAGLSLNIINARSKGQVKGNINNGKAAISAALDYTTDNLVLSDPAISAETLAGEAKIQFADALAIDTTVSIANLTGAAPLPPLSLQQLDGNLVLEGDKIDGNGIATLSTELNVPWTLTKRLDRIVLGSSIIASVPVLYEWLQPAIGTLAESVNLSDGRVRLDSEFEIDEFNKSMVATGTATNLSGSFEDVNFDQASVTLNATDVLTQKIDLGVEIANGEFANGAIFGDVTSDVRIDGNKITIDKFAARSFEAGFVFSNLVIGEQGTVPASVVKVDGLNLSVVTSALAKEQLNATGKMSGEIPFRITDRGVAIDDGHLESDGNGTIAYRSGGSEQNVEGLNNIALQALENFQYDKVELNLGYTEEGEYLAGFRLSGNNPNLYDGYPVVLNLNINGQLPGLLRSSLIGGSFDEEILRTLPQNPTQNDK